MPDKLTSTIRTIAHRLIERYDDPTLCEQYAWWMVEHVTKKSRAQLLASDYALNDEHQSTIDQWIKLQVVDHMPLQYLIGTVPFADLDIIVEPPILIPRPETEEWVLTLIDRIKGAGITHLSILDLCTGSGCIALALAQALPNSHVTGVDLSYRAIELSNKNAAHNTISNVTFIESDLMKQLGDQQYDIIVANPPYIAQQEWNGLDESVRKWEDHRALIAEDHGLAIITRIITLAPTFLNTKSSLRNAGISQLWIEIGYQQGPAVSRLYTQAGYSNVMVLQDLEGKDRVVVGDPS